MLQHEPLFTPDTDTPMLKYGSSQRKLDMFAYACYSSMVGVRDERKMHHT